MPDGCGVPYIRNLFRLRLLWSDTGGTRPNGWIVSDDPSITSSADESSRQNHCVASTSCIPGSILYQVVHCCVDLILHPTEFTTSLVQISTMLATRVLMVGLCPDLPILLVLLLYCLYVCTLCDRRCVWCRLFAATTTAAVVVPAHSQEIQSLFFKKIRTSTSYEIRAQRKLGSVTDTGLNPI